MKKTLLICFAMLCLGGGASVSPEIRAKKDNDVKHQAIILSADSLSASMEHLQVATESLNKVRP